MHSLENPPMEQLQSAFCLLRNRGLDWVRSTGRWMDGFCSKREKRERVALASGCYRFRVTGNHFPILRYHLSLSKTPAFRPMVDGSPTCQMSRERFKLSSNRFPIPPVENGRFLERGVLSPNGDVMVVNSITSTRR